MGISSLGIGSGLDLKTLLEGIKEGQEARLKPITKQQKNIEAKVSSYGLLKNALAQFNTVSQELQKPETFNSRNVINSNESVSVIARSGAALGEYSIQIDQLASAHSVASEVISDSAIGVSNAASRTITIEQESGQKLTVSLDNDKASLHDIAKAINEATSANKYGMTSPSSMNATVMRSSADGYQLVISSKETGQANAIKSISSSDTVLDGIIGFKKDDLANSSMTETQAAKDAKFNLNGISISNPSNTISNVVDGVDITLKSPTSSATPITIEANNSALKNTVKSWVTAFNQIKSTIAYITRFSRDDTKEAAENKDNGALLGDSVVRDVDNTLRSVLSQGQSGKFSVLSDIGITMEPSNGLLSLSERKLDDALNKNSDDVSKLFVGDGNTTGIANQIVTATNNFIQAKGRIANAENGLTSTQKSLNKRYDQIEDAIDQSMDRYRTKFNKLDVMSSSLGATTNYLKSQLSGK